MGTACSQPERACSCPQSSCCKTSYVRVKDIIKHVPLLERHKCIVHYQVPVTEHYQIIAGREGVLHQGAYNTIYKARHKRSNILRALKQVRKGEVDMAQWKHEVEVMQCCDHPHICRLYETFSDGKILSQVMELCLGRDLLGLASLGKQSLTEGNAAWLVRQMVGAIGHLHAKGVCHSQLKPECFTFTKQFTRKPSLHDLCLKLTDIGLAVVFGRGAKVPVKRKLEPSSSPGGITPPKTVSAALVGRSKAYCQAPEQALGESHGDYTTWAINGDRCDIWALGAIAFFIVSGRWPATKIGVRPEELPKSLSHCSGDFISRCLVSDPHGRSTADELREDPWMVMAMEAYEESLVASEAAPNGKRNIMDAPLLNADSVLKGFQQMSKMNDFERAAVTAVAHHLPEDKTAHLRKVFQRLDANGDGTLTAEELHHGLIDVIEYGSEGEFQQLLAYIDTDGSGCIDYTEFIAATYTLKASLKDEVCEAAFRVFDKDGSGAVTLHEVNAAIGESIPMKELKELMAAADKENLDGELDIGEFKRLLFQDAKAGKMPRKAAMHSYAHNLLPPRSNDVKHAASPRMSEIRARNPRPKEQSEEREREEPFSSEVYSSVYESVEFPEPIEPNSSMKTHQAPEEMVSGEMASEEMASEEVEVSEEMASEEVNAPKEKGGLLRSFTRKIAGKEGVLSKLKRAFTGQVSSPKEQKEKKKKKKGSPSASPARSPSPSPSPKTSPRSNASKRSPRVGGVRSKEEETVEVKPKWEPKGMKVVGKISDKETCDGILNPQNDGVYGSARQQASPRQKKKRETQAGKEKALSEGTRKVMEEWENQLAIEEYLRTGRAPLAIPGITSPRKEKGGMLLLTHSQHDVEKPPSARALSKRKEKAEKENGSPHDSPRAGLPAELANALRMSRNTPVRTAAEVAVLAATVGSKDRSPRSSPIEPLARRSPRSSLIEPPPRFGDRERYKPPAAPDHLIQGPSEAQVHHSAPHRPGGNGRSPMPSPSPDSSPRRNRRVSNQSVASALSLEIQELIEETPHAPSRRSPR